MNGQPQNSQQPGVPPTQAPKKMSTGAKVGIIIGCVAGGGLLLLAGVIVVIAIVAAIFFGGFGGVFFATGTDDPMGMVSSQGTSSGASAQQELRMSLLEEEGFLFFVDNGPNNYLFYRIEPHADGTFSFDRIWVSKKISEGSQELTIQDSNSGRGYWTLEGNLLTLDNTTLSLEFAAGLGYLDSSRSLPLLAAAGPTDRHDLDGMGLYNILLSYNNFRQANGYSTLELEVVAPISFVGIWEAYDLTYDDFGRPSLTTYTIYFNEDGSCFYTDMGYIADEYGDLSHGGYQWSGARGASCFYGVYSYAGDRLIILWEYEQTPEGEFPIGFERQMEYSFSWENGAPILTLDDGLIYDLPYPMTYYYLK